MVRTGLFAIAGLVTMMATGMSWAQSNDTPGVDARQERQQGRIADGVASGELTPREAARLERGQARIEKMEDKAKADGVVTKQERAHLQAAQNRESRKIARQKHDRQRR